VFDVGAQLQVADDEVRRIEEVAGKPSCMKNTGVVAPDAD
jgi:hypothetical protein